jgi:dihydroflavonol-4-reductase
MTDAKQYVSCALVTGGTGFVGANLVAALGERGIVARVLRRETSPLDALKGLVYEDVLGDILDSQKTLAAAMEGCDWVFHVAAVSDYWRRQREQLYRVNVEGTANVLAAARLAGVGRFVFTSSLAALGLPANGRMLHESSHFNLEPERFPYAHSKHLAEEEVLRAAESGLEAVIVNPSVVLGPRDINQISGSIIIQASSGRLFFYPTGGVNYVAVEDVAAGHIAAAERGRAGERYILAGENLKHREALNVICEIVRRRPPFLPLPKPILSFAALGVSAARALLGARIPVDENQVWLSGRDIFADGSKAAQELAMAHTPFRIAVQRTYDWYNTSGYIGQQVN